MFLKISSMSERVSRIFERVDKKDGRTEALKIILDNQAEILRILRSFLNPTTPAVYVDEIFHTALGMVQDVILKADEAKVKEFIRKPSLRFFVYKRKVIDSLRLAKNKEYFLTQRLDQVEISCFDNQERHCEFRELVKKFQNIIRRLPDSDQRILLAIFDAVLDRDGVKNLEETPGFFKNTTGTRYKKIIAKYKATGEIPGNFPDDLPTLRTNIKSFDSDADHKDSHRVRKKKKERKSGEAKELLLFLENLDAIPKQDYDYLHITKKEVRDYISSLLKSGDGEATPAGPTLKGERRKKRIRKFIRLKTGLTLNFVFRRDKNYV